MELSVNLIRLHAACAEWSMFYKLKGRFEGDERNDVSKRMSELTREITRLENATGARSRNINTFLAALDA